MQATFWSYIRLLLCLASACLVARLFSDGADDAIGVWVTVLGNWLAIWLFFELRPLSDEQYTSRMLLVIFKYGPLALFLFILAVALLANGLDMLYEYVHPATNSGAVTAYT